MQKNSIQYSKNLNIITDKHAKYRYRNSGKGSMEHKQSTSYYWFFNKYHDDNNTIIITNVVLQMLPPCQILNCQRPKQYNVCILTCREEVLPSRSHDHQDSLVSSYVSRTMTSVALVKWIFTLCFYYCRY